VLRERLDPPADVGPLRAPADTRRRLGARPRAQVRGLAGAAAWRCAHHDVLFRRLQFHGLTL